MGKQMVYIYTCQHNKGGLTVAKKTMTTYEWSLELADQHGDIQDSHFFDRCPGIPADDYDGLMPSLVLVRDTHKWDDDDEIKVRSRWWAYVKDGKLPERFSDVFDNEGPRVPRHFHAELQQSQNS